MTEPEAPAADEAAPQLAARRFRQPARALGLAVEFLRSQAPFAGFRFGTFAGVLSGQVRRGHYLFAQRGSGIVGYAGWALCTDDVARAWVEQGVVPGYEQCLQGEAVVVLTFAARDRAATFFLARQLRRLYPGQRAWFLRDYGGRRRFGTAPNA